jgi:hypothetical protein
LKTALKVQKTGSGQTGNADAEADLRRVLAHDECTTSVQQAVRQVIDAIIDQRRREICRSFIAARQSARIVPGQEKPGLRNRRGRDRLATGNQGHWLKRGYQQKEDDEQRQQQGCSQPGEKSHHRDPRVTAGVPLRCQPWSGTKR